MIGEWLWRLACRAPLSEKTVAVVVAVAAAAATVAVAVAVVVAAAAAAAAAYLGLGDFPISLFLKAVLHAGLFLVLWLDRPYQVNTTTI